MSNNPTTHDAVEQVHVEPCGCKSDAITGLPIEPCERHDPEKRARLEKACHDRLVLAAKGYLRWLDIESMARLQEAVRKCEEAPPSPPADADRDTEEVGKYQLDRGDA